MNKRTSFIALSGTKNIKRKKTCKKQHSFYIVVPFFNILNLNNMTNQFRNLSISINIRNLKELNQ
uniref:Putative ovule protein n=1 Tax=Solanum chacoense TaxID=4108 RepID=A0A0V0H5B7_SOLCH